MECLIAALCRVNVLMGTDAKGTQRLGFGRSGKGIERQVAVLALCQQRIHYLVTLFLQFFFGDVLQGRHLA